MPSLKKIFLILAVLFIPAILLAERKPVVAGRQMPNPNQFVSEAVYISSCTCAVGNDLKISTHSSLVMGVSVTTPSVAGSVGFYDSRTFGTANTRMLASTIATNVQAYWPFQVGASSGIVMSKIDGACVTVHYLEQ